MELWYVLLWWVGIDLVLRVLPVLFTPHRGEGRTILFALLVAGLFGITQRLYGTATATYAGFALWFGLFILPRISRRLKWPAPRNTTARYHAWVTYALLAINGLVFLAE